MGGVLGEVTMAATSMYVADLDTAVEWYREMLDLEPVSLGTDRHPYATYSFNGALVVLEPLVALYEGGGATGSGATSVNLVVDRDPAEVRADLVARGVDCSEIVESNFSSFLVRDPDGNRFYVTAPLAKQ